MSDPFAIVRETGATWADVQPATRYDGSPLLQVDGCFMAGLTTHPSAEPDTLVVRADPAHRALLLEEAPDTYYLTPYHERHPVVLVRLRRLDRAALHDLLAMSRRLTLPKTRAGRRRRVGVSAESPEPA
jgi:hypothetical protein